MLITIDGSYGEGGGQILRSSLAVSSILKKPVQIINIRHGRKKPGLLPQHLTCVRALTKLTNAKVEGAQFQSTNLIFQPQVCAGGKHFFNVAEERGSAGSVGLVCQAILPVLWFADSPSEIVLDGGTHVPWSPPVHYLQHVFLSTVKSMGLHAEIELQRWGWYPKGQGKIELKVYPVSKLDKLEVIDRGELKRIYCISAVSNLPRSIAERQANQVHRRLKNFNNVEIQTKIIEAPSIGQGTFVFILSQFEHISAGFSALGERGKPAEKVADESVDEFLNYYHTQSAVDTHLADQLVLYIALSSGCSQFTTSNISEHLLTNIWVIEQFLPVKFKIEGELNSPGKISVKGIDFLTGMLT